MRQSGVPGVGDMFQRRVQGFSVIELMIAIAVVAILITVALPSFQQSLRSNRVSTASNELITSLSLARSEALRNPRGAVICSSQDGATCAGDWNDGWIVWIDADGNGLPGGAGDRLLRAIEGNDRLDITAAAPGGPTFANRILFDNRGRVDNNDARVLTVRYAECNAGDRHQVQINVSRTGQVRSTRQACP